MVNFYLILKSTYLDNYVDVAQQEGKCSQMVKHSPFSMIIAWFASPYTSHGETPENVHDDKSSSHKKKLIKGKLLLTRIYEINLQFTQYGQFSLYLRS